jgi:S-adenosylmethionine decarboxylase
MHGAEWVVDARGCNPAALRDPAAIRDLISSLVSGLRLHPVGEPLWHTFPVTSGITALLLLSESHLTVHTFPEYGSACVNVFCCRARDAFDFKRHFREHLGAGDIEVRRIERWYGHAESAAV